jgi:hypothetical protein
MGIFYEYGVEYGYRRVVDGTYVTLIPIREFDARFLASDYYRRNRRDYEAVRTTWLHKANDVGITLTVAEETFVRGAVITAAEQGGVSDVGFYSVCRSGPSL